MMKDIKAIRTDAGLTRASAARMIGMPLRTLEEWEHGRRNPPEWVMNLAKEKLTKEIELMKENEKMRETRYDIIKNRIEVKHESDIREGVTLTGSDQNPEAVASCATKEEALKVLENYKSDVKEMSGYYLVTEYYVEEEMYEDGELYESRDILAFAPFN